MCCRLLGVEELQKPPMHRCPHCRTGVGCGIYADRPNDCRTYRCEYRHALDRGEPVPLTLRPDHCHVVLDTGDDGVLYVRVDQARANAWNQPAIRNIIADACRRTQVSLVCGTRQRWFRVRDMGTTVILQISDTAPGPTG